MAWHQVWCTRKHMERRPAPRIRGVHACPEILRRIDLQVVGRSDFYGGHFEIASSTAALRESKGKDNLAGVYEISRGITTTIAKMRLKTLNNIQKSGYATLIYAKNVMKEWGV